MNILHEIPDGGKFANENTRSQRRKLGKNFQEETEVVLTGEDVEESLYFSDIAEILGVEPTTTEEVPPSIVVGGTCSGSGDERPSVETAQGVVSDRFTNWIKKRSIGNRKVKRSLSMREMLDLQSAWFFARRIGMPMNRFITIRPADIDQQRPDRRVQVWTRWREKLSQFARDNGFEPTYLWTRESEHITGHGEHQHILMSVPPGLTAKFDRIVKGWRSGTDEIDVRPATYRIGTNKKGGDSSVLTYVTKACPQARLDRVIRPGGPIFGKRFGMTRNINETARVRDDVRGALYRDLGLAKIHHGSPQRKPVAGNDDQPRRTDAA